MTLLPNSTPIVCVEFSLTVSEKVKIRRNFFSFDALTVMVKLSGWILVFHQLLLSTKHYDRASIKWGFLFLARIQVWHSHSQRQPCIFEIRTQVFTAVSVALYPWAILSIRVISISHNHIISVAITQTHGRSRKTGEILITMELSSHNLNLSESNDRSRFVMPT